jgi:hypothetical protein
MQNRGGPVLGSMLKTEQLVIHMNQHIGLKGFMLYFKIYEEECEN